MKTKFVVLGLISVLIAGCATTQKPYTAAEAAVSDNMRLCRTIGWAFYVGNPEAYQIAATELRKRDAFGADCANIATIEFNSRQDSARRSAATSQAFADALNNISRDAYQRANQPIYTPSINCRTTQTSSTTSSTHCH